MDVTCARCGKPFESKSRRAKYCSPRCRTGAHRSKTADPPTTHIDPVTTLVGHQRASVSEATLVELGKAGALDSALGQAALRLAMLIDVQGPLSGSAAASLVKEYRATMAEAVKANAAPTSLVDELRKRREQRGRAS